MILTIDVGNTNTVFALLKGDEIAHQWRISTREQRTTEEYQVWISQLMAFHSYSGADVSGAIIASVVPQVVWPLQQLCQKFFHCEPLVVGNSKVALDIEVCLPNPEEVGADRLVNAVAANKLYGGPLVVVDFGTATTFDVVGEKGEYLGGVICPGINLSLDALHQAAAKLPRIAIAPPKDNRVTGKTTLEAMQFGIFWGYLSMVEGLVARLKAEHGNATKVVATGGLAPVFAHETKVINHVNGELTLQGLGMLYRANVENS